MAKLKEFTKTDIVRDMYDTSVVTNEGCVCIIPLDKLAKKFRKPEYQLFRIKDGSGVRPASYGNACFGHFCVDGEKCRWEKFAFLGVADKKTTKLAAAFETIWQRKEQK